MILRSGYSVKFKGTAVLIAFEHYFDWKNLTYVNNRTSTYFRDWCSQQSIRFKKKFFGHYL